MRVAHHGWLGTTAVVGWLVLSGAGAANTWRSQGHVEALADERLEGRLTGSAGARLAAEYIAGELRRIGARPLPGQDDVRLPFTFTAGVRDAGSTVRVHGDGASDDEAEPQWSGSGVVQALPFSETGEIRAPVVFAGYGLSVPESQGLGYDSYATLDVRDKIVLVLRYYPEDADTAVRSVLTRYSGLRFKALVARERGARALLVVTGPRSPRAGETVSMSLDTGMSDSGILAASIGGEVARALFDRVPDRDLAEVQAALDGGNPHVAGFALPGVEVSLTTRVEREERTGENIVGYLPATAEGTAAPAKPYVLLGAHYDHLGRGDGGHSLAREGERNAVHPGADDNASGVAAILVAAADLAAEDRQRGIVLAFWSGEELGLLGSSAFTRAPPVPVDEIAAYLNFDMVGRMRDNRLVLQAVGTSSVWKPLIERINVPIGFDIVLQPDPWVPTDVTSLNQADVPSLGFFTGSHEDYHRPTDRADTIGYEDLDRVAQFGARVAAALASREEPPDFIEVARTTPAGGDRDTLRTFTGTIPDYAAEVEGLRLAGTIEGGPAARAGLREGDVITEFAGQTITNIYDYTYALDAVKVGEPVNVVFTRDGERLEVTITPEARR